MLDLEARKAPAPMKEAVSVSTGVWIQDHLATTKSAFKGDSLPLKVVGIFPHNHPGITYI